jgi:CheY-like chemotaxis protein
MLNLLSNAVKYNHPTGHVEIVCQSSGGTVSIAVIDSGPGIAEGDVTKLFAPFERLAAEGTAVEGSGIGLALSRALAHGMGGTLGVFSTVGVGSTFTLELPEGIRPPLAERAPEPAAVVDHRSGLATVTVLAIEDNVANVRLFQRAVALLEGVELLTAIQGELGLDLARHHRPDLILLDLHLPDLSGVEVLRRLRADPITASTPVVICSADASTSRSRELLGAGATAYLTKPIDLTELFGLIEQARPRPGRDPHSAAAELLPG